MRKSSAGKLVYTKQTKFRKSALIFVFPQAGVYKWGKPKPSWQSGWLSNCSKALANKPVCPHITPNAQIGLIFHGRSRSIQFQQHRNGQQLVDFPCKWPNESFHSWKLTKNFLANDTLLPFSIRRYGFPSTTALIVSKPYHSELYLLNCQF